MKKTLNNPAMLAVFCILFFVNSSFAAFLNPKSSVCLKLNGLILKSPMDQEGLYKVQLFSANVIVDSNLVSVNKPFEFSLAKNSLYTVRISKDGFIPLLIKVDTKLTKENLTQYEFRFQTELHHNTIVNTVDKSILDKPIGVVRYDEANNRFYPMECNINDISCLKLNGLVLKSPVKAKGGYLVELLQENAIVGSEEVLPNETFEFTLKKDVWYTLRITKEGFVPLLISIDTKLAAQSTTLYEFSFETELYHTSKINTIDKHSLDLPIGLIKFDESNNRFYPIDDYRAHVRGSF